MSRIGPVTGTEALLLALTAAADPHARWQVIVTDPDGYATAAETIRRRYRPGAAGPAGVTGQVTVTIPASVMDQLARARPGDSSSATAGSSSGSGSGIRAAVLRAARRALARARRQAAADAAAPGGCAHTAATAGYRPTTKIRDYVTARDQTCRNPRSASPPATPTWIHTTPYDQGGRTCGCNLSGHCRTHHKSSSSPAGPDPAHTRPLPAHHPSRTHLHHHPRSLSGLDDRRPFPGDAGADVARVSKIGL